MKRTLIAGILASLLLVSLCLSPSSITAQALRCGAERWAIKTGSDSEIDKVFKADGTLKKARKTTIQKLIDYDYPFPSLKSIPKWAYTTRMPPVETNIWRVEAKLTEYKYLSGAKDDKDYHLVLEDEDGFTIIAEIPNPACSAVKRAPKLIRDGITQARRDFDARLTATGGYKTANLDVVVEGIGMFDKVHGQRGVADNGVEIHPVLSIRFK